MIFTWRTAPAAAIERNNNHENMIAESVKILTWKKAPAAAIQIKEIDQSMHESIN